MLCKRRSLCVYVSLGAEGGLEWIIVLKTFFHATALSFYLVFKLIKLFIMFLCVFVLPASSSCSLKSALLGASDECENCHISNLTHI